MDAFDWIVLGALYVAATWGFSILFWDIVFPAIAGEEEGDE